MDYLSDIEFFILTGDPLIHIIETLGPDDLINLSLVCKFYQKKIKSLAHIIIQKKKQIRIEGYLDYLTTPKPIYEDDPEEDKDFDGYVATLYVKDIVCEEPCLSIAMQFLTTISFQLMKNVSLCFELDHYDEFRVAIYFDYMEIDIYSDEIRIKFHKRTQLDIFTINILDKEKIEVLLKILSASHTVLQVHTKLIYQYNYKTLYNYFLNKNSPLPDINDKITSS